MIPKWIADLMAWNRCRTYGVAKPPPSSCTSRTPCSTCPGNGWLPPIGGKPEDGGRHCPECNPRSNHCLSQRVDRRTP